MNYLNKKVEEITKKVEQILNKGVVGGSLELKKTLECHFRLKILLDELEYTIQKDIPEELVLRKISSIEKEIKLIQKKIG